MGDVIKPDFKARRRRAKLLKQQERREELMYKLGPYLDIGLVVLIIGSLIAVLQISLG